MQATNKEKSAQKAKIDAIERLKSLGEITMLGPYIIGTEEGNPTFQVELNAFGEELDLSFIRSFAKGKATPALEIICKAADDNQCPIKLIVDPSFGKKSKRLRDYYRGFGFRSLKWGMNRMVRTPVELK